MKLPEKISNLADNFSRIPGIGGKTALRHVLTLSSWDKSEIYDFVHALKDLATLEKCRECGMFSDSTVCEICNDQDRKNEKIICVVESITDCLAIERSEQYRGTYHVLGGVLNPLLGIGPDQLNFKSLLNRIGTEGVENIILAINPSVEGDATCAYIREVISDDIQIDRIGFGIPIGGSLDYLDSMTISKALENRQKM